MTQSPTFDLDNPPEGKGPIVKLAALVLRECVTMGTASARLGRVEGDNTFFEVDRDGTWTDVMAFPSPVYEALVAQLRSLANVDPPTAAARQGVIRALWHGEERTIGLTATRPPAGPEHLELTRGD